LAISTVPVHEIAWWIIIADDKSFNLATTNPTGVFPDHLSKVTDALTCRWCGIFWAVEVVPFYFGIP
jgi:hypothetical protein